MAMLIGKFHKLIQSRLLWGIFAVLIVLYYLRRLLKKLFGESRRPQQPYPDA